MAGIIDRARNYWQGRGPTHFFKLIDDVDRVFQSPWEAREFNREVLDALCGRDDFVEVFGGRYAVLHPVEDKVRGAGVFQVDSFTTFDRAYAHMDSVHGREYTPHPEYVQRKDEIQMGPFRFRVAS